MSISLRLSVSGIEARGGRDFVVKLMKCVIVVCVCVCGGGGGLVMRRWGDYLL